MKKLLPTLLFASLLTSTTVFAQKTSNWVADTLDGKILFKHKSLPLGVVVMGENLGVIFDEELAVIDTTCNCEASNVTIILQKEKNGFTPTCFFVFEQIALTENGLSIIGAKGVLGSFQVDPQASKELFTLAKESNLKILEKIQGIIVSHRLIRLLKGTQI